MVSRKSQSFPLRLGDHVREQAAQLAQSEGVSLNQFISIALAEKISRMEHESWLTRQSAQDSRPRATPVPGRPQGPNGTIRSQ